MKSFLKSVLASATLFAVPALAFAELSNSTPIGGLLIFFNNIIKYVIPMLIGVAVVVFFYYIVKYLLAPAGADEKKASMTGIWKSLLAIGIMLTFFGIIRIVVNSLGLKPGEDPTDFPTLPL